MVSAGERGCVLLAVLAVVGFLSALAAILGVVTVTEVSIAANHRESAQVRYAAEAGIEFVVQELAGVSDWAGVVALPGQSAFVDGAAAGVREVGPYSVDLTAATGELEARAPRIDGASPRVLYAFGPLGNLVPAPVDVPIYVAVWVAQFLNEDASPRVPAVLSVLSQAWGPRGGRQALELIVEQGDLSTVRRRSWREWP